MTVVEHFDNEGDSLEKRVTVYPNVSRAHGGKRKGAGRPKKEPTKTMRIPISKIQAVKKLIAKR